VDLLDDGTQEVFIIVARKLEVIEPGHERSFTYGTAIRVAANLRRSRQASRFDQISNDTPATSEFAIDPEQLIDRKRLRELLDRILDTMPDELREVFVLFEFEKLTRRELSKLLQIPGGTVASRLRRAREIFQDGCAEIRANYQGDAR
jgi:RNA polymerase sigma-70 factor (ECF subfamily)